MENPADAAVVVGIMRYIVWSIIAAILYGVYYIAPTEAQWEAYKETNRIANEEYQAKRREREAVNVARKNHPCPSPQRKDSRSVTVVKLPSIKNPLFGGIVQESASKTMNDHLESIKTFRITNDPSIVVVKVEPHLSKQYTNATLNRVSGFLLLHLYVGPRATNVRHLSINALNANGEIVFRWREKFCVEN